MRFEISDFRCQTERGRFEEKDLRGETVRRQAIRLAERLVMFQPLTVDHMVAGDFSTPLRSARNDGGFARQSDGQIKESTIKIFLIDNVENSAD